MITDKIRLLSLLFCIGCATQVPPSGGPEDKTPPKIVKVIPENKATNVPLDQTIEFHFSEGMNHKTLERAIFITPDPGDAAKFDWKGDRLVIEYESGLSENRTYVFTLGTDLQDLHGNGLRQSYTLAFSTGDEISDGKISGRVYPDEGSAKSILIWAYLLENDRQPDPTETSGDYITQTDNSGKYQLSHLSEGRYRVFAIRDTDGNRFFEVGLDGIGVPFKEIVLRGDSLAQSDLNFKTTVQDTVGPGLLSASASDRIHLSLNFDDELQSEGAEQTANYVILHEAKGRRDTLAVKLAYLDARDPKIIHLITEVQTAKTEYLITARNLLDTSGNPIDLNYNSAEFIGSARPDTLHPQLVETVPKDSARAVSLDARLELHFSETMNQASVEQNFLLQNSADQTDGDFIWLTPASLRFIPEEPLRSLTQYRIELTAPAIFDLNGNALADSAKTPMFETLNIDTLGSISGEITDPDSTATGRIFITAKQNKQDGAKYDAELSAPGTYQFAQILPGVYRIEVFRDRDANGKYSYGSAYPFQPSERFVVYSDSIKVRARWPNEGNHIFLPE